MSVRLLSFGGCLGLAALVWGASVAGAAPATPRMRPPGRSIEFSQPKTDEVSTNLSELAKPRGDGLLQLEKSLRGQSDFLRPDSFSDAAPVPYNYPTIIVPNKRRMEQLERQRDWGSMTPEQLLLGTSDKQDLLSPSDNKEKPLSKQGDPYRMERQSSAPNASTMSEDDSMSSRRRQQTDSAGRDSSGLLPGVKEDDSSIRRLFGIDADSGFTSPGQLGRSAGSAAFNFGGERNGYFSRELHQQRMQQFKQTLDGLEPVPMFSGASFGTPGGPDSLAGAPPQVVTIKSEPISRPLYGRTDSVESRYGPLPTLPGGAPEPKSFSQFDQWAPRPKMQPQPQPVTAPQVPSFTPPKRPFM